MNIHVANVFINFPFYSIKGTCITGLVLSYVVSPQQSKLELISSSLHHINNTTHFTERSKVTFGVKRKHTS